MDLVNFWIWVLVLTVATMDWNNGAFAVIFGAPCSTADDCKDSSGPLTGLDCGSSDTCECQAGYVVYPKSSSYCVKSGLPNSGVLDDLCENKGCAGILVCGVPQRNPRCACPPHFIYDSVINNCRKLGYRETCDIKNDACGTRLFCNNGACTCVDGTKRCTKSVFRSFGGDCMDEGDCITDRKLICQDNKCTCPAGEIWLTGMCQPEANRVPCDPNSVINVCHTNLSENLECEPGTKFCVCPTNTEYSHILKGCRLKSGEDCSIELQEISTPKTGNTSENGLCASQGCCNKKCGCPSGPGWSHVWSSQLGEGCVLNHYGFPCNGTDCRHRNSNTSRPGLMCINGVCQCGSGLTYSQGYCVRKTLLHGETCDPSGIGGTCKTDAGTGLTCAEIEEDVFQCVCTPKIARTLRQIEVFVIKEWNSSKQICDWKADAASFLKDFNPVPRGAGNRFNLFTAAVVIVFIPIFL